MSELRDHAKAFVDALQEVEVKGGIVRRAVRRAIDPILPGLAYFLTDNDDGYTVVYVRHYGLEPNPYPPGPGKRRLDEVILEAVPELECHIDSDVWVDQETAKRIQDAVR